MQQAERDGTPIPDVIVNAPDLQEGLDLYLNAYLELSSCRHPEGYIPWTDIAAYCRAYEFDRETIDEVLLIVRRVDHRIQEYRHEKQQAKMRAETKGRTRS